MTNVNEVQHAILINLIQTAGAELLKYWNSKGTSNDSLGIQEKSDGSSVTNADFASNQILVEGLVKTFPDYSIISEEMPVTAEIKANERIWIIDPLDGTKSFIEGRDDFSILLGLSVRKVIEYGLMYFPVRNILAYASSGQGAYVNGKRSLVSSNNTLRENSLYYRNFSPKQSPVLFHEKIDSGLAFLNVASGVLDAVVIRMKTHKEWDLAAPVALILESGGKVTDEQGDKILFGTGDVNFEYLVVSNGKVHSQVLDIIASASN